MIDPTVDPMIDPSDEIGVTRRLADVEIAPDGDVEIDPILAIEVDLILSEPQDDLTLVATTVTEIADVRWRQRARVRGTVRRLRIEPWDSGIVTLECLLADQTGGLFVVFVGRRRVAGIELGRMLEVEGTVIESRGELAFMNPEYTFLPQV